MRSKPHFWSIQDKDTWVFSILKRFGLKTRPFLHTCFLVVFIVSSRGILSFFRDSGRSDGKLLQMLHEDLQRNVVRENGSAAFSANRIINIGRITVYYYSDRFLSRIWFISASFPQVQLFILVWLQEYSISWPTLSSRFLTCNWSCCCAFARDWLWRGGSELGILLHPLQHNGVPEIEPEKKNGEK